MAKFNGRDIMLIGCLLGGGTSSSDIQMYATKVDSGGDECPDTLLPDDVYFTIPAATVEGQREPQVGDYLIYDCLVANASGYNQILCEITSLDERGDPYRYGVHMRAICFMAADSNPLEASTDSEMAGYLTSNNWGKVVKYFGETTDTYEHGAYYVIEVSE